MKWIVAVLLSMVCASAQAGDSAFAVRDTNLKSRPYYDAETITVVAANSQVEVLQRKSSWTQVKVAGKTGWVKMLSLRLGESSSQKRRGDSGLASLFNVASTGSSGSTVTTGVRGLSEEQLKNTHANPKELAAAQAYAVDRSEARRFAQAGKLSARKMDYLPAVEGDN